jgi:predicted permease
LTEADAHRAAPPVVVIGYDTWQTRFSGDPNVVGRTVQLGAEFVTVVGVMPEGYQFPVAHDAWTPLRQVNDFHAPRSGPPISVFGVLAPDTNLDTARAELKTVGQTTAAEQPTTHAQLEPRVGPYAMPDQGFEPGDQPVFAAIHFLSLTLLALICSNVALLLFARAATREAEFTVRTALGASRRRIVTQLFMEALVLGGVAAVVGLTAAHLALTNWGLPFLEANYGRLPFWFDVSLTPVTVLFALGLTLFGSAIAGVIPALKVTRQMSARLKQSTAGAGGLQFGGIWTVVIVVQVAVTVAFPAVVYQEQWLLRHAETFDAGIPIEEYLTVRINPDPNQAPQPGVLAAKLEVIRQRIAEQPGVSSVTFANRVPRDARPQSRIELPDDERQPTEALRIATVGRIEPSYFEALDTPVLAGRAFVEADIAEGNRVAIVDQGFVDQVLQGQNAVGQLIRFTRRADPNGPPNPWVEIVGVVKELGMGTPTRTGRAAGLYLPSSPEQLDQVHMLVHLRGDPLAFVPPLRQIVATVDPTLRLSNVQRLDQVTDAITWVLRLWVRITIVMTLVAILLSLSGIYSVLSFIVARRTREIGIRVALGADRGRVISAIFRRPLIQVSLGVLVGNALLALIGTVETELPGLDGNLSAGQWAILAVYGVVMLGVCLLACIVPTRRALRVEPTVALRMD